MENNLILHMTHFKNLKNVIKSKGLICVSKLVNTDEKYINIAHNSIQDRRASFLVPIEPNGTLHDYVPFYFAPRSPMLYSISKGNVGGYTDGQKPIIYLVSKPHIIKRKSLPFCFTDGHGIMTFTDYFNDLKDLDKVDWDIMKAKYWTDTEQDHDRRRRRMAEFLVYKFVPIDCFIGIGVYNDIYKGKVEELLDEYSLNIPVKLKTNWYY
jgi:ssDNA thymidine ADP-ribosyltransferase, DarT